MELILSPDTELYPALAGSAAERDYHPEICIPVLWPRAKTCTYADPANVRSINVFPNPFGPMIGIRSGERCHRAVLASENRQILRSSIRRARGSVNKPVCAFHQHPQAMVVPGAIYGSNKGILKLCVRILSRAM